MDQATILFWVQLSGVVVQFISLVFLIIYVVKTWEMASATRKAAEATQGSVAEMRESRDQQTAPYVIVYFDIPFGTSIIYLVVKNIGATIANNVRLEFTPPLSASDGDDIRNASFVKDGIAAMPPGFEIRALFDTGPNYFGRPDLPLRYQVKVTYSGGVDTAPRVLEQVLDLSVRKGIMYIRPKTIENIADELENIRRELARTGDSTQQLAEMAHSGITISNPSFLIETIETALPDWKRALIAKFREFELMWTVEFAEQRAKGFDQSRIQAYTRLTSRQVLLILSRAPEEAAAELIATGLSLAIDLHELALKQFYMDGGASVTAFNEAGDKIVEKIIALTQSSVDANDKPTSDESPANTKPEDLRISEVSDDQGTA